MSFVCPECCFRSEFSSALTMHRQLHHGSSDTLEAATYKASTLPPVRSPQPTPSERAFNMPSRTTSATRMFERFRSKICRSKACLSSHLEELELDPGCRRSELSVPSECTSKGRGPALLARIGDSLSLRPRRTYDCHLCSFVADRITVLDRHLLNDHKIGLESLMRLVIAKTRDGLSDPTDDISRPYYKVADSFEDNGELVIQTVAPKIRVLKHAATNTECPDDAEGCLGITRDLQAILQRASQKHDKNDFLAKVAKFNECMNQLFGSASVRSLESRRRPADDEQGVFELGLDGRKSSNWDKAYSDSSPRRSKMTPRMKPRNEQSYYF